MTTDLMQHRLLAAECSGGTSGSEIKNLVVKLIRQYDIHGKLLDYGAGKGELLGTLEEHNRFVNLTGADILPRPSGLPEEIQWFEQDLNNLLEASEGDYDVVVCSEVIEHLENPRLTFRNLNGLLKKGGHLIVTTPNQECVRSYLGLFLGGHFTHFLGASYPAHITALLRVDCQRICAETGFAPPVFSYTNLGGIPKMPSLKWQSVSLGLLKGRLFSDNIGMITTKN